MLTVSTGFIDSYYKKCIAGYATGVVIAIWHNVPFKNYLNVHKILLLVICLTLLMPTLDVCMG